MAESKDYWIVHNNVVDGGGLKEFFQKKYQIGEDDFSQNGITYQQVLNYEDNADRIVALYDDEELKTHNGAASVELLKFGTDIKVEKTIIEILEPSFDERVVVHPFKDIPAFWGEQVQAILDEGSFVPTYKEQGVVISKKQQVFLTVFAYSRVLGKFINLTPFVGSCNTSNMMGGGNFNFSIAPITASFTDDLGAEWTYIKENMLIYDDNTGEYNYKYKDSSIRFDEGKIKFNKFFFSLVLSAQDMIFIKFEKTILEEGRRIQENFLEGSFRDINANFFDMMGLVDSVRVGKSASSNDVEISVQGRDFNKVILDDNIYFYPITPNTDPNNHRSVLFANEASQKNSFAFQRVNRVYGEIQDLDLYTEQPIANLMEFLISKMSNLEVFKSTVFNGMKNLNADKDVHGIWKLVKLFVDPSVRDRILVDSSMATMSGSIMSFIYRICQEPLVEFFTDTYENQFYWFVRRPPYNKESYKKNETRTVKAEDLITMDVEFNDNEAYGWFRIVPRANFYGDTDYANYAFPAIFLKEYAEIYGTKSFEFYSSYIDYGINNKEVGKGYQQCKEDLRMIVEQFAYLPFSRKGSITINGDRTIRKGMNIYLETTDELYYVSQVTNYAVRTRDMVDRYTVLSLDRGIKMSEYDRYFNLVDFGDFQQQEVGFKWDVKVNKENFDYFINKRQFGR